MSGLLDDSVPLLGDTNILFSLARRDEWSGYLAAEYRLFTSKIPPFASYVSVAEVRVLAAYHRWGNAKMNQLGFVLSQFRVVHIDESGILEAYIEIDVFSRKRGIVMGKNDLWIAATARVNKAMLLTTDRDFDHLDPDFLTRIWVDPTLGKQTPDGSSADNSNRF